MTDTRWQVVVLGPPDGGLEALGDLLPDRLIGPFPLLLRPRSEADARALATRLRGAGAEVVVARMIEDGPELRSRRRWRRIRQLAWVLLLAVVIFKVAEFRSHDEALLFGGGTIDVGVMQFAAPEDQGAPIVQEVNDGTAIVALEDWFNAEYRRYTGRSDAWVELHPEGPWGVPLQPPSVGRDMPTLSRAAHSISYVWWWENMAADQGVEADSYGVRLYIAYLPGTSDQAADSRGDPKRRTAVAHVSASEDNVAYVLTTMAHEIAHALGATDRYDLATFLAEYPEGYVEPLAAPLFPQRYAEVMAVDRPSGMSEELEVESLDQLRVGHRTAAELRWISHDEADYFYAPNTWLPEERVERASR
ncbi:MAG TPA: hypothetical protein QGF58_01360 [Myxococcota bacterium]|nr:hypothetical protein [Myxococcota bacterium]